MSSTATDRAALIAAIGDLGRDVGAHTVMFHSAVAERMGLNATDHKALDLLARRGAVTAGELADLTGLTTGAVTGVIDRLEQGGFVRRARDPHDRRKVVIEPVHEHERMRALESTFAGLNERVAAVAARYSDAELALIGDFLARSAEVLHDAAVALRQDTQARRKA